MVKPKADDHGEKSSGPKGWPGLADCFVGRLGRMRRATTRAALRAFVAAATNRTVSISSGIALAVSFQEVVHSEPICQTGVTTPQFFRIAPNEHS
jgi:hypothetical protein